jgi:hypothetical protein
MHEALGLLLNYILLCFLMLLPLYAARHFVPGPTRFVEQQLRRVGRFAYRHLWEVQKSRRGVLFTLTVHLPLMLAIVAFIMGIVTGTWQAILASVVLAALAILARRGLASLARLRRQRRTLPSRRR